MIYPNAEVTFTDPRNFDGNCYDVAERAVAQCAGILKLYDQALSAAMLMARNAHMERNLAAGKPPAGDDYINTPEGRKFIELEASLRAAEKSLGILQRAVAFDPKHPARV